MKMFKLMFEDGQSTCLPEFVIIETLDGYYRVDEVTSGMTIRVCGGQAPLLELKLIEEVPVLMMDALALKVGIRFIQPPSERGQVVLYLQGGGVIAVDAMAVVKLFGETEEIRAHRLEAGDILANGKVIKQVIC